MDFNNQAHDDEVTVLARDLAKQPDKWLPMLAARYSKFLRLKADRAEATLAELKARAEHAPDQVKFDEYVAQEQQRIDNQRDLARDIATGVADVHLPARCEAIMRLYEKNTGTAL